MKRIILSAILLSAILGLLVVAAGTAQGQTLQSETTWGAAGAEFSGGVAVALDGSSYLTGTSDSFAVDQFGTPSPRIFLLRFAADGSLDWQRIWNGDSGPVHNKSSVAIGNDGSVYVTGHSASNDGDAVLLKFSAAGSLLWEREWGGSAQESGSAVATDAVDGSVVHRRENNKLRTELRRPVRGEAPAGGGVVDLAALLVKIDTSGNLVFDREFGGKGGEDATGVSVAQDGSIYMSGTSTSFGGGSQDAFVVRVQANGKAGDAATWGGPGFETGGGVGVTPGGTVVLGATTTVPPPYALLPAPRKVSSPHGTFGAAAGALTDATGVVANPAAGATTTNGATTYSGNFEAALVRFIF